MAPLTAQTLLALGLHDEVERYARWGRDIAAADDIDAQMRWRVAVSGLRSRQGHHEEAIVLAREAVVVVAPTEFVVSLEVAQMALARRSERGEALAALDVAHEAQRLATTKKDEAALRTIAMFLKTDC